MGSRSVPKGKPLEGPAGVDLSFEEGEGGNLHVQTTDYHDPGVLGPSDQFELGKWLLQRAMLRFMEHDPLTKAVEEYMAETEPDDHDGAVALERDESRQEADQQIAELKSLAASLFNYQSLGAGALLQYAEKLPWLVELAPRPDEMAGMLYLARRGKTLNDDLSHEEKSEYWRIVGSFQWERDADDKPDLVETYNVSRVIDDDNWEVPVAYPASSAEEAALQYAQNEVDGDGEYWDDYDDDDGVLLRVARLGTAPAEAESFRVQSERHLVPNRVRAATDEVSSEKEES